MRAGEGRRTRGAAAGGACAGAAGAARGRRPGSVGVGAAATLTGTRRSPRKSCHGGGRAGGGRAGRAGGGGGSGSGGRRLCHRHHPPLGQGDPVVATVATSSATATHGHAPAAGGRAAAGRAGRPPRAHQREGPPRAGKGCDGGPGPLGGRRGGRSRCTSSTSTWQGGRGLEGRARRLVGGRRRARSSSSSSGEEWAARCPACRPAPIIIDAGRRGRLVRRPATTAATAANSTHRPDDGRVVHGRRRPGGRPAAWRRRSCACEGRARSQGGRPVQADRAGGQGRGRPSTAQEGRSDSQQRQGRGGGEVGAVLGEGRRIRLARRRRTRSRSWACFCRCLGRPRPGAARGHPTFCMHAQLVPGRCECRGPGRRFENVSEES